MKAKTILNKIRSRLTKGQEWMVDNIQYLTLMGSHAYGMHRKDSDWDVYGFTIPPKEYIFTNTINGFDTPPTFDQFLGNIKSEKKNECLDFQIFNITKYFKLIMQNNPNMIDSLFTRPKCELIVTDIGRKVKDNRKIFLHKGAWHRFKGYAFSQLNKIRTNPAQRENSERKKLIKKFGYDTKFALHIFRLLNEIEQILTVGDVDLLRNKEQLKQVANGYYTLKEIDTYFKETEKKLENAYNQSTLPYSPRTKEVRNLLSKCLNEFYG